MTGPVIDLRGVFAGGSYTTPPAPEPDITAEDLAFVRQQRDEIAKRIKPGCPGVVNMRARLRVMTHLLMAMELKS